MSELRYDPLAQLHDNGDALVTTAERVGLDTPVPWCPGWQVRDLLHHIGEVWHFWAHIVDRGITDVSQLAGYDEPAPPADADVAAWTRAQREQLSRVLGWSDPSRPLWTWANTQGSVAWVRRRMAQETAVHRFDAEGVAATGWRIDAPVAADGIDEFLEWFTGRPGADALEVGGTVHLHCTDEGLAEGTGEWIVHGFSPDGARFERVHAKGDAAVRGRAHDLLLWLWRRPATVEVLGDAGVAERFVRRGRLG
jgi:uncharacterized protein (TIGR03083 family)